MTHDDSEFIGHEPCEKCGSSDGLARYDDGHGYCFSCKHYEPADGERTEQSTERKRVSKDLLPVGSAQAMSKRGLSEETCAKWGYTVSEYHDEPVQVANYRDMTGALVAQKVRFKDKKFKFLGDTKEAGLYGQHLWRDGGKRVVITEGEIDALTVSQLQGNRWPVVSLPNGAQGAKKALQRALQWLLGFDEIVLLCQSAS